MTLRRRIAYALFGRRAPGLHRLWWRVRAHSPLEPSRTLRVTRRFVQLYGLRVRHGPFAGMRYPKTSLGATVLVPKLLGSFETELHPILDGLLDLQIDTVVNIGCAEGYYAVGLAMQLPSVHVYAFDTDPNARHLCAKMAQMNGVRDRLRLADGATTAALRSISLKHAFVLADCEGCELEVLDPGSVPDLARAYVLVELHDFIEPGTSDEIRRRFEASHDIRVVDSQRRNAAEYPELASLSQKNAAAAVSEGRPAGMQWAWMRPRFAERGRDAANE
jgi:hypothetical protein